MKMVGFIRVVLLILCLTPAFVFSAENNLERYQSALKEQLDHYHHPFPAKFQVFKTAETKSNLTKDTSIAWQSMQGPFGGSLTDLIMSPDNPAILYAATCSSGVFKSRDSGLHWFPVNNGFLTKAYETPFGLFISKLAVEQDITGRTTLFAATGTDGLYKSADGGQHWIPCSKGIRWTGLKYSRNVFVYRNPEGKNVILFTMYNDDTNHVYRSVNDGFTWGIVDDNLGFFPGEQFFAMNNVLYTGGGILLSKSLDEGRTWMPFFQNNSLRFNLLTGNKNQLFIGGGNAESGLAPEIPGLWMSTSNGKKWSLTSSDIEKRDVRDMVFSGDTLFAATATNARLSVPTAGIYQSTDQGNEWTVLPTPFINDNIWLLKKFINTLYAGIEGGGIYQSQDNGKTWKETNEGLLASNIFSLFSTAQGIYAGTANGVYFTRDQGKTWESKGTGLNNTALITALTQDASGNLYAGGWINGVFKSSNGGKTWAAINTGLPASKEIDIYSLLVHKGILFAAMNSFGGVWKSLNGGATWEPTNLLKEKNEFAFTLADYRDAIYVGTSKGVFKSVDNGLTWAACNQGFSEYTYVYKLLVVNNQTENGILYAATSYGVYKSVDGAKTWVALNQGLEYSSARDIVQVGSTLFVTSVNSIYFSRDGGQNWVQSEMGLGVHPFVLATDAHNLYVGTGGQGVYKGAVSSL